MPVVVADTGPVRYLVLIGEIVLLPRLFTIVLMPEAVSRQLRHRLALEAVRNWIVGQPAWLRGEAVPPVETLALPDLDDGERAVIALARRGRCAATRRLVRQSGHVLVRQPVCRKVRWHKIS